jgi:hypothetical protein
MRKDSNVSERDGGEFVFAKIEAQWAGQRIEQAVSSLMQ